LRCSFAAFTESRHGIKLAKPTPWVGLITELPEDGIWNVPFIYCCITMVQNNSLISLLSL
jgi:hypothetical protein